ncbi:hypothetical protein B296_00049432 [Ensete ventricosum]|uniref:Uncharacterized protein n=1 Tax=Ensete ventricosum TaxID=4639 RepID=A0A426YQM7_ENSVE|nr:hypothetical protein B296_00049432 [Ensete ventricosum]
MLQAENKELKSGAGPEIMAAAEKRATELSTKVERLKAAVGESEQRCKNHKLVADSARRALARKFSLNSLASWSKQKIKKGFSREYHIQAGPRRVVRNAQYIRASGVQYSTICALKAFLCSIRSELPSYASRVESQKFCGISLSSTFGTKGDPPVELSPSSFFDLTNSF